MLKIAFANCCMSLISLISTIPEIVNAVTMNPYTTKNLPIIFVIVPDIFILIFIKIYKKIQTKKLNKTKNNNRLGFKIKTTKILP